MDRHATAQIVAMVVVLFVLLRWVPSDDPRHPLGMGQPWNTLEFDLRIADASRKDRDYAVSLLRFGVRPRTESGSGSFSRMLSSARTLRRTLRGADGDGSATSDDGSAGPDDPLVQFMGVFRNDVWWLTYALYPVRCTTFTLEEGSRMGEDEPIEGAILFPEGHTEAAYQRLIEITSRDRQRRLESGEEDDVREEGGQ